MLCPQRPRPSPPPPPRPQVSRFSTVPRGNRGFICGPGPAQVWKSHLGYSNPELAEECKKLGLTKSGGRLELVMKLVQSGNGEVEDYLVDLA